MTHAKPPRDRYTFGEGRDADRRLEEIASFFNAASQVFVRQHAPERVSLAVDIGCGPGHTTQMLRGAVAARLVVGLDLSHDFLRRAASRTPGCRFVRCDLRQQTFPCRPDLAFCRFVLSHLPDAPAILDRWATALAPTGRLLVDELEHIETEIPVFRRYLETSGHLVASQGARLWIGARLRTARYRSPVLLNETVRLEVPAHSAAAWFHPNTVTVWEREPAVLDTVSTQERRDISAELAHIRDSRPPLPNPVWIMRRMVLGAR